jgi:hypothetical protein
MSNRNLYPRRRAALCVAVIVALFFAYALPSQTAYAAETKKVTVSGVGEGSSGSFTLAAGDYRVKYSYDSNVEDVFGTGEVNETNFISVLDGDKLSYAENLTNDIKGAASGEKYVSVEKKGKFWITVDNASDSAHWNYTITPLGSTKSKTFKGTGMKVSKKITLAKGTYKLSVTYSGNKESWLGSESFATNFISHLESKNYYVVKSITNDIKEARSVTKKFKVNKKCAVWIVVDNASYAAEWSFKIKKV